MKIKYNDINVKMNDILDEREMTQLCAFYNSVKNGELRLTDNEKTEIKELLDIVDSELLTLNTKPFIYEGENKYLIENLNNYEDIKQIIIDYITANYLKEEADTVYRTKDFANHINKLVEDMTNSLKYFHLSYVKDMCIDNADDITKFILFYNDLKKQNLLSEKTYNFYIETEQIEKLTGYDYEDIERIEDEFRKTVFQKIDKAFNNAQNKITKEATEKPKFSKEINVKGL